MRDRQAWNPGATSACVYNGLRKINDSCILRPSQELHESRQGLA
jgi:hypothetical protein